MIDIYYQDLLDYQIKIMDSNEMEAKKLLENSPTKNWNK